jgi:response regulator RpfG family c-di-GMP phosphodiesterase
MDVQSKARILIVDDDPAIRRLLVAVLRRFYSLKEASTGEEALAILPAFAPDVVLLDIIMPGIDGYETCRRLKSAAVDPVPQVIMVSARTSRQEQLHAYEANADDYVIKPFDAHDLLARVTLHIQLRDAKARVRAIREEIDTRDSELKRLSAQQSQDIVAVQDAAVFTLAKVAESRDHETGGHLTRIRMYSQILGEELALHGPYVDQINAQFLDDLYRSSPMHDIGKVGIRDDILLKPGRLTPEEFETMRQHTVIGANILDEAVARLRGGGFLAMAALIARFHHERFDGAGYPAGLVGHEIPLPARIVAVADVYDALTSVRPYKPAYPAGEARAIIHRESGRHFDPMIVDAFLRRSDDILRAQEGAEDQFPVSYGAMAFREFAPAADDIWPATEVTQAVQCLSGCAAEYSFMV